MSWLQVAPLAAMLLVFFGMPMLVVVAVSFFDYERLAYRPGVHPRQLQRTVHLRRHIAAISTLKYVVIVWAVTLVIGFTLANFLVFHVSSLSGKIGFVSVVHGAVLDLEHHPHDLVDSVPRPERLVQHGLMELASIDEPLEFLLFSDFAVIVAYVHLFTLFMMVPIFNSMARIDPGIIEAARMPAPGAGASLRRSCCRCPRAASRWARFSW